MIMCMLTAWATAADEEAHTDEECEPEQVPSLTP